MITKEARDDLARILGIVAGARRGEYHITNEITFHLGYWLMDHGDEVLTLIDTQSKGEQV